MRRIMVLAITFLAGAIALIGATSAGAGQPYTPAGQSVTCSPSLVTAGATVTCTASGFGTGTEVAFAVEGTGVGSAVANESGVAALTFTVPDLGPGTYTVTASGVDAAGAAVSASTAIEVVTEAEMTQLAAGTSGGGPTATSGDSLPVTGSSRTVPLLVVAIALITAGGFVLLGVRQRRAA